MNGLDYERLFDAMPTPCLIMTAGFTIVTVNDAYARATMIDRDAVAGRPMFEVFPDNPELPGADGVHNLRRSLRTVVETGRSDAMALQRYDIRAPDGQFVVRYWSPVNAPVLDERGQVKLIVHQVQDVTELVATRESEQLQALEADLFTRAQELQEANQRLREASTELRGQQEAKDRFIATLSHELRNPLASARAALDVLGPGHPALAVIDRQLTALTRMTDDLLDATRVMTGRLQAARHPMDLRPLVHAVVDDLRVPATKVLPAGPVMVDGDPVRLGQMLTNLVDNAYKHASGVRVTVTLQATGGDAELRVRDSGGGFDPALAETVFDPFMRAVTGRDAPAGLGLGLAVVRGIAESHDGTVSAHSDGPGTGATFTVRLPLTGKPVAEPAPPAARSPRRVLLIDDNSDLAEMYAAMLRRLGDTVTVATTAGAGLDAARATAFDLVLCDLALGEDIDGYEIARRLRRSEEHRDTPLVAVSGFSQDADRARSGAAGFDAHFAKPLDLRELDAFMAARTPRPERG
ncbi:hypothetical protein Lesp02_40010 [Lentzea sp. NBRC 105346]|uniref:hybrid sensor histidine kinase/response regulator n=1 Tax=Lentzea sp. NBRC 105346 TaxID=3032205 RepID=UPI0024A01AEC|nr:ATP-binding protein [Lentzea sp. NBRC 105346]GLZ31813.1 hypothetical protein Lesp02_40010 [Lentzea sp. NBRC 105346]